jgi:hypothetical protein
MTFIGNEALSSLDTASLSLDIAFSAMRRDSGTGEDLIVQANVTDATMLDYNTSQGNDGIANEMSPEMSSNSVLVAGDTC